MMRPAIPRSVLALVPALALGACELRQPGPLEADRGKVTYWEIVEASIGFDRCTDEAEWRAGFDRPEELVGGFISYRLSDDGGTATSVSCETTDPTTCVDTDPPRVYTVTSHTLRFEEPERTSPVVGFDCEQAAQTDWNLVDEGDELSLTISTSFILTGTATACEALDRVFVELGSDQNELGIKDCVVTVGATGQHRGTK